MDRGLFLPSPRSIPRCGMDTVIAEILVTVNNGRGSRGRVSTAQDTHLDEYSKLHREGSLEDRTSNYQALINAYYDLATVFYEWDWGSSFHFSSQFSHESFDESIRRHQYQLAGHVGVFGKQFQVLDLGCGIGGPMHNLANFLQYKITGIPLNQYQVDRGNELRAQREGQVCRLPQCAGKLHGAPFRGCSLRWSVCDRSHLLAPDRVKCYGEVFRVLKPMSFFSVYEWCMTDKNDPYNKEHQRLKKDIEEGNGLPDSIDTNACLKAMREAGFEILSMCSHGRLH